MMKGFMLASPSSGAGKTLLTLSLLRVLKNAGLTLAPAKAGPDYIDPAFHQAACGTASYNLDGWAMRPGLIHNLVADITRGGTTLVVEAMMGLFDGAADGTGSAALLAEQLGLPIVLVIDCARLSHSVAPLVHGFNSYCPHVRIAGLILNKVGSQRHENMLRDALAPLAIPVIGVVRRHAALALPERHLGLVQACEQAELESFISQAAAIAGASINVDKLLSLSMGALKNLAPSRHISGLAPLGSHIAIARDEAFQFAYPHMLAGWHRQGAAISFFSPLADEAPPAQADAIFLPGGYPELHAGKLAAAARFRHAMRCAADQNRVIYGECGGYMVLGHSLEDEGGVSHPMLGLLPLATSFKKPRLHLGYRALQPATRLLWQKPLKGHEFHYATTLYEGDAAPLFKVRDALGTAMGTAGLHKGNIAGSFIHIIDAAG